MNFFTHSQDEKNCWPAWAYEPASVPKIQRCKAERRRHHLSTSRAKTSAAPACRLQLHPDLLTVQPWLASRFLCLPYCALCSTVFAAKLRGHPNMGASTGNRPCQVLMHAPPHWQRTPQCRSPTAAHAAGRNTYRLSSSHAARIALGACSTTSQHEATRPA